jgi:hypothetical protein
MVGHEDGSATLGKSSEEAAEPLGTGRVQASRRLVEDDELSIR